MKQDHTRCTTMARRTEKRLQNKQLRLCAAHQRCTIRGGRTTRCVLSRNCSACGSTRAKRKSIFSKETEYRRRQGDYHQMQTSDCESDAQMPNTPPRRAIDFEAGPPQNARRCEATTRAWKWTSTASWVSLMDPEGTEGNHPQVLQAAPRPESRGPLRERRTQAEHPASSNATRQAESTRLPTSRGWSASGRRSCATNLVAGCAILKEGEAIWRHARPTSATR